MVMKPHIEKVYDDLSKLYDSKYVSSISGLEYMKDEFQAESHFKQEIGWRNAGFIYSLGCGTGQDISITKARSNKFVGFDISLGMIKEARSKFPKYRFIKHDCNEMIVFHTKCDTLVSMFGTPNYLGISKLREHINFLKPKQCFFVFYDEHYKDGIHDAYSTNFNTLENGFIGYKPRIRKLRNNYLSVTIK
jgi:ubiquinone/menaquinone biosynthesis C-methylase UbiE